MSEIMKGFAHGMRVGTTGDSSRLQRMAAEVTRTSTVARAWQNVGQGLRSSSQTPPSNRPSRD